MSRGKARYDVEDASSYSPNYMISLIVIQICLAISQKYSAAIVLAGRPKSHIQFLDYDDNQVLNVPHFYNVLSSQTQFMHITPMIVGNLAGCSNLWNVKDFGLILIKLRNSFETQNIF